VTLVAHTDVNILNVGAGSCAVIESPSGRNSMIDINDGSDLREAAAMSQLDRLLREGAIKEIRAKLADPIAFCRANGIDELWRFILSHPDADHMAGVRRILGGELPTQNFWDIPHQRVRSSRDEFKTDAAYEDWLAYQGLRDGTLPNAPKLLNPLRGSANHFWIDDDIEILSPTPALVADCDKADCYNDASYVLRVNHGPSSVLLPGDVESKAWNDMIDSGRDLSADVLVASHHGRKSGYSDDAMQAIDPTVVIISTDKLDPAHDAEADYRRWTPSVYSTRKLGTLWVRMYDNGAFDVLNHAGKVEGFVRRSAA
jgi:competence protein ComEC